MVLQLKSAFYNRDWTTAASVSEANLNLGNYDLVPDYGNVININNENNEEIIFNVQHVFNNDAEDGSNVEKMYANASSARNCK
jgi:hypothetical protein